MPLITDPYFYLVAIPAVLLLGLSKSGFGAGFGSLAVPMMALAVTVPQAAAILMPVLLLMDLLGMAAFRKDVDRRLLMFLIPWGLLGIVIGALLFKVLDARVVAGIVGVFTLLFLALAGIEVVLSLAEAGIIGGPAAVGWRLALIRDFGFSGDVFDWMVANMQFPLRDLSRVVSYSFIHLGFTHAIFACVLLLALGKMVAEAMGQVAFLAIFFVSGIFGAVVYALVLDDPVWLVGAYPSVYGLIGGYSFVMWRKLAG